METLHWDQQSSGCVWGSGCAHSALCLLKRSTAPGALTCCYTQYFTFKYLFTIWLDIYPHIRSAIRVSHLKINQTSEKAPRERTLGIFLFYYILFGGVEMFTVISYVTYESCCTILDLCAVQKQQPLWCYYSFGSVDSLEQQTLSSCYTFYIKSETIESRPATRPILCCSYQAALVSMEIDCILTVFCTSFKKCCYSI